MTELPEAPASVTYDITSPNGFNVLFTVRDMTGMDLLMKMTSIEAKFKEQGYKPHERGFAKKEAKPVVYADHMCPSCGKRVVIVETSKGKIAKCETQKYDFTTKSNTGCAYSQWLKE